MLIVNGFQKVPATLGVVWVVLPIHSYSWMENQIMKYNVAQGQECSLPLLSQFIPKTIAIHWRLTHTACELWTKCGDTRKRDWREVCSTWYSKGSFGKVCWDTWGIMPESINLDMFWQSSTFGHQYIDEVDGCVVFSWLARANSMGLSTHVSPRF